MFDSKGHPVENRFSPETFCEIFCRLWWARRRWVPGVGALRPVMEGPLGNGAMDMEKKPRFCFQVRLPPSALVGEPCSSLKTRAVLSV